MPHPSWILGLLMAMLTLCDADGECYSELNPLNLDPPEVVGELGEEVLLNCTSFEENHDGIFLKYENTDTDPEEEKNFLLWPLLLNQWNMTAKCIIKLSDTLECSKDLKITVYQTPTLNLLPPNPMVEGDEYLVNCDINNVAPVQSLRVKWYRGNETLQTQTFNDTTVMPVNVSSTLRITAERGYHGELFKCEAELDLGPYAPEPKPTASLSSFSANVHYRPQIQGCPERYTGVEHDFSMDMLPCRADGNPVPTLLWYYEGKPINESEPLTRTGSGTYRAEAQNVIGRSEISVKVTIEYAPELKNNTEGIFVNQGDNVSLACGAEGSPLLFMWTCDGENMKVNTSNLDVTHVTTNINCTCTAYNHLGNVSKQICVHVATSKWTSMPAAMPTPEPTADTDAPELKNNTEDIFVNQGDNVSLACGAEGSPLLFMWTCDGENMKVNTSNLDVTHVTTNINCTCTAYNHLGTVSKQIRVHVATSKWTSMPAAMPTPQPTADTDCPLVLTPAEVAVRFGDPVLINCSSSSPAALGIGWEVPFGESIVTNVSVHTWIVQQMTEWTGEAVCVLNQGDRLCSKAANITLYKTPDNMFARIPDVMMEGVEYPLNCDIIRVAPVQSLRVKWYRGNESLQTQTFNNDTAMMPVNVSSTLRITAERGYHGELFRCEAELDLGPYAPEPKPTASSLSFSANVHYRPQIQGCPERYTGVEHDFSMDMLPCRADGNPAPTLLWYYEGNLINESRPLTRTGSGTYRAEAKNSLGNTLVWVDIIIEYEPLFTCGRFYEVKENEKLKTMCELQGVPPPVVAWIKDGKELETSHQWKKDDRGNYSLRATNAHGTASHSLYLDVLYAPVFNAGNSTQEVTPGENVSLLCSADANPAPEIQWYFPPAVNVNTTGWRNSVVQVREATSTNAGVYMCVATNKVGHVTRYVALVMKGKTSALPPGMFWGLLTLLIIIVVLALILLYCTRWKKNGQYTFVPSSSKNEPDSPMPLTALPEWMQS